LSDERITELEVENDRLREALAEREAQLEALHAALPIDPQIRLVADALPVLISYIDADHRYRYNNKAYEDWFGRGHTHLSGRHMRDVLGAAAYDRVRPLAEAALAGERVSSDVSLEYSRGGTRNVHLEYVPDRQPDGSIPGFYVLVQDLTESRRAEEALRRSEAQQRAIIDATPECVKIVGPDGRLVQINAVGLAMVEANGADQLCGTSIYDVIAPEFRQEWRAMHDRVCAGESLSWEFDIIGLSGTRRRMETHAVPLALPDGRTAQLAVTRDISARREAEKALRESEARFRAMADSAPAPVWVTNAEGIDFANRALCDFTGLSVEELRGDRWMTLAHPDDIAIVLERREDAWRTHESYGFEARFRRQDGEWRWLKATCQPRQGKGGFLGFVGLAVDVTDIRREMAERRRAEEALRDLNQSLEQRIASAIAERERAEAALRQAQKMEAVGQLTGGIAHDFNNLLTVIGGNLDMAARRLGEAADPRVRRAIAAATTGAQRAATLTQRLLAFSRRQPLAPKPTDANALLAGMSELLHRTLGETVEVETRLAGGPLRIEVDPHQLESAILNLAVNARDAMPGGGRLVIETGTAQLREGESWAGDPVVPGRYVRITVSDSGVGMNEDTRRRAVEPFFTTKDVGKGTGLGLSMVYGFVRQSGGQLRIESKEGDGTRIHIYLPRLAAAVTDDEPAEALAAPRGGGEETVLVCEDDDDVRAYTVELLDELGYRVIEAPDGASTMRILRDPAVRVDILFTDVVLPGGMSGAVLAQEAREARPGLKILFTTGYARDAIVHEGRLDPGIDLVAKPFTCTELAARVREALDRG
jgi:PAS domain S-box-containing protein